MTRSPWTPPSSSPWARSRKRSTHISRTRLPPLRAPLLAALERLDQVIDSSDAYESSTLGSAAFGYSTKGSVIGETGIGSAAEEISGAELRAQTSLVKAAKEEVRAPTPDTLRELRVAQQALAEVRGQDSIR